MVETTLNYLAKMPERPVYYTYEPPSGVPWRNTNSKSPPPCFPGIGSVATKSTGVPSRIVHDRSVMLNASDCGASHVSPQSREI